jgi:hypothetical protein
MQRAGQSDGAQQPTRNSSLLHAAKMAPGGRFWKPHFCQPPASLPDPVRVVSGSIMSFNSEERALLAALADVLIPADGEFPSASEAGVAADGLDQVLAVRPELREALRRVLAAARGRPAADVVAGLRRSDPAGYGALTEFVPGAYFLNPQVRQRLGYRGQTAQPIEPHRDHLADGLIQSVIDRGPIYRPTPERAPGSGPATV